MTIRSQHKPSLREFFQSLVELTVSYLQKRKYLFIQPEELNSKLKSGNSIIVVDCRDEDSFSFMGHIPGAINIPYVSFMKNHHKVPIGGTVITVCYVGYYSRAAAQRLAKSGHKSVFSLIGGMEEWEKLNYPLNTDE